MISRDKWRGSVREAADRASRTRRESDCGSECGSEVGDYRLDRGQRDSDGFSERGSEAGGWSGFKPRGGSRTWSDNGSEYGSEAGGYGAGGRRTHKEFRSAPGDGGNLPGHLMPLSRELATLLRHRGHSTMDDNGWCSVHALLEAPCLQSWTHEDVEVVVRESFSKDKPRFELQMQDGGPQIRATHNHSLAFIKGSRRSGQAGRRGENWQMPSRSDRMLRSQMQSSYSQGQPPLAPSQTGAPALKAPPPTITGYPTSPPAPALKAPPPTITGSPPPSEGTGCSSPPIHQANPPSHKAAPPSLLANSPSHKTPPPSLLSDTSSSSHKAPDEVTSCPAAAVSHAGAPSHKAAAPSLLANSPSLKAPPPSLLSDTSSSSHKAPDEVTNCPAAAVSHAGTPSDKAPPPKAASEPVPVPQPNHHDSPNSGPELAPELENSDIAAAPARPATPPFKTFRDGLAAGSCVETPPLSLSTSASTDEVALVSDQELTSPGPKAFFIGDDDGGDADHEDPFHLVCVPEVPEESAAANSTESAAATSSADNSGPVILQPGISNLGNSWSQYKLPESEGFWWSCGNGDHFVEESPGDWRKYRDPDGASQNGVYWWNDATQEWFFP